MKSMRNILFISFHFPPENGAAPLRQFNITSRLIHHGIRPIVITSHRKGENVPYDFSLLEKLPKKIGIIRLPNIDLFRSILNRLKKRDLFIPDYNIDWMITSLVPLILILRKIPFEAIYTTGPPFTDFLFGFVLKFLYRKPLFVSYRDPWVDNPYNTRKQYSYQKKGIRFLEKTILKRSNGVFVIASPLKTSLEKEYPFLRQEKKCFVFPSAMDISPQLLKQTDMGLNQVNRSEKSLIFVLTSGIYGERDPTPVFAVIHEAEKQGLFKDLKFVFHIIGHTNKSKMMELIKSYQIEPYIIYHGVQSHEFCQSMQDQATFLVDISEKYVDYPSFPFHFWEYMQSGKMILFFGKEPSYKAQFLRESHVGYIFPLNRPIQLQQQFLQFIEQYRQHQVEILNKLSPKYIQENSWDSRIARISRILKKIIALY